MTPSYTIRPATAEDMPQVLELIQELATFEREPEAVILTSDQLVKDGFGEQPLFQCFVADEDGVLQGMAFTYMRYSTWKGPTLHLEDLIVRASQRGRGIGYDLFARVISLGHERGVKRIEWAVLDWNTPAIEFYERQGARVLREWDTVHMDEEGIQSFIESKQTS